MTCPFNTSYIEISTSALVHNMKFIHRVIRKNAQITSVVKGNAYGHGIDLYVPLAESCGFNHFSVFSADEARQVFHASKKNSTIMIMGHVEGEQLDWAITHEVQFYVFEMDRLEQAVVYAKKRQKKAIIHVEVETGMNRTGFNFKELEIALKFIEENQEWLTFQGLCTHFAGAESVANYYRIQQQQKQFEKAEKIVAAHSIKPAQVHLACSAAALRYPKSQRDMVRLGIIQYGFFPTNEVLIEYMTRKKVMKDPLRRLITWKSSVMDIKKVNKGEFIGYGTSYLAGEDCTIATIPVGYSTGFSRSMSNAGRVLIHGERVPVIGTVNMNMMTVDITKMDGVKKGDEVVIIGKQGDLEITISSFSEFSELLNYELLTRLPADIPRRIVD